MAKNQHKEDLDAFLTTLEAKMRGPYSSLDLAKIVATHSLRGSLSPQEYLQNVAAVLSRTDKMTQLRTLVGLLGLDPGKDTDTEVYNILTQSQESPLHEEWVRVVAGLARGILFVDADDEEGTRESCRGEEAADLLDRTCKDIVEQTRQLEKETENVPDKGKPSLQTADMYPLFVSYRYSLLNPDLLGKVIPEHKDNPHFQVNRSADILRMDYKLEKAKVDEAQASKPAVTIKPTPVAKANAVEEAKAVLPGSKSTQKAPIKGTARAKTSMFMPTRRPATAVGRGGRQMPMKGSLHTRKAGAAQSLLVNKNRRAGINAMGGAGAGAAGSGTLGRAQKLANNKSKMKMIDVTEVQGLNKEHKQREVKIAKEESKESKMLARKRKIMEAAAEKGLVALPKIRKLDESMQKGKKKQAIKEPQEPGASGDLSTNNPTNSNGNSNGNVNEECESILNGRSNKLSEDDRERVQQFFTDRFNPTPDQPIYKMKLHEERTTDPENGQAMKNTYYLELDYSSFTTKQTMKTKRY